MMKTNIHGYTVEMDDSGDGMNCFINSTAYGFGNDRRDYSASLAALQDTGQLEAADGRTHKVHVKTIEAIEQWALDNGY